MRFIALTTVLTLPLCLSCSHCPSNALSASALAAASTAPTATKPRDIVMQLAESKLLRATMSRRQLEEVLTDFWFNHFNVFSGKSADKWDIGTYERDAIPPKALVDDLATFTSTDGDLSAVYRKLFASQQPWARHEKISFKRGTSPQPSITAPSSVKH